MKSKHTDNFLLHLKQYILTQIWQYMQKYALMILSKISSRAGNKAQWSPISDIGIDLKNEKKAECTFFHHRMFCFTDGIKVDF